MNYMHERAVAMRKIQQLGFAMTELGLYLNNQPCCKEALSLFCSVQHTYEKARKEYERKFGPLTYEGIKSEIDGWSWINDPWPWQGED